MSNGSATIQTLIDDYIKQVVAKHPTAQVGVVIGAVTSAKPLGELFFSSATMTNQSGQSLALDGATPFELGSISKVFTVGIYCNLQNNLSGTLGEMLGSQLQMSSDVQSIPIECLAAYSSGLPQDNGSCTDHPKTGYPWNITTSLANVFNTLANFSTVYSPITQYSYSNLGMSLLAMAALRLNSTDTNAFGSQYNNALIQYCQKFGVDPEGSIPTTAVYNTIYTGALPTGYNGSFSEVNRQPCDIVEYGSGGIVSTGSDMLKFLVYSMSADYPVFLQEYRWQHPPYCDPTAAMVTSGYGWFLITLKMGQESVTIVVKDGGVAGFTSWLALQRRPSSSNTSPCGVFVLTNGPDAGWLGRCAFAIAAGASSAAADYVLDGYVEQSPDPAVH